MVTPGVTLNVDTKVSLKVDTRSKLKSKHQGKVTVAIMDKFKG